MANIQIFEINEDGELLVNDPELAGVLEELKPEELSLIGGTTINPGCTINNHSICTSAKLLSRITETSRIAAI